MESGICTKIIRNKRSVSDLRSFAIISCVLLIFSLTLMGCGSSDSDPVAPVVVGDPVAVWPLDADNPGEIVKVSTLFSFEALGRTEIQHAVAGEIVAVAGIESAEIAAFTRKRAGPMLVSTGP